MSQKSFIVIAIQLPSPATSALALDKVKAWRGAFKENALGHLLGLARAQTLAQDCSRDYLTVLVQSQ
jgi:hypothetical protein